MCPPRDTQAYVCLASVFCLKQNSPSGYVSASLKHRVIVLSHQNLDGRTYFGNKESQLSLMLTSDLKAQYKMLEV